MQKRILGADLEVVLDNADEGWINILEKNQVIDKGASLFKIPHHGSKNGYHERIWNEILLSNPVSKLTPWNKKTTHIVGRFQRHCCPGADKA